MDVHDKATRSHNMAAVKGKDTKPEIAVRQYLKSQGFGYRKNYKGLPGKPDIVLTRYKTAIFVNGCFWHQHRGCRFAKLPSSNRDFWIKKLTATVERDKRKSEELIGLDWSVIVIWECQIKDLHLLGLAERIRNNPVAQQ